MEVKFEEKQDVLVIRISGRLAGDATITARQKISEQLEAYKKVVFDLSKTSLVDSAGLGVFVSVLTKIQKQEGKLVAYGLSEGLKDLMRISSLGRYLNIFETEEEAIKAF